MSVADGRRLALRYTVIIAGDAQLLDDRALVGAKSVEDLGSDAECRPS